MPNPPEAPDERSVWQSKLTLQQRLVLSRMEKIGVYTVHDDRCVVL